MLSKSFCWLGWTRDDRKWLAGIIASIVVGLVSLGPTVTDYGVPASWLPYLRLASLIVGIVSGKMATSGLPGKDDANTVDMRNRP